MSSRAVRCRRKLFSGKDVSALGMQLWLPTGKTGHSCEGISRGSRRQSQGRRPHAAPGACACPSVWPGHGGASASNWEGHSLAKDKAAQCCGHRICPGDTSMTLATQSGDKGVARSKARALPQTPQKPLGESELSWITPRTVQHHPLPPGAGRGMHRAALLPHFPALPAASPQGLLGPALPLTLRSGRRQLWVLGHPLRRPHGPVKNSSLPQRFVQLRFAQARLGTVSLLTAHVAPESHPRQDGPLHR